MGVFSSFCFKYLGGGHVTNILFLPSYNLTQDVLNMNFVHILVYKLQEKGERCPGTWPSHLGNMSVWF